MRLELVHRGEHTVHLRLRGDIDETAAASLGDNIARFAAADRHVEIDCSAMGYLDASGLTVLLQLRYERSLAGGRLTLDNLPPAVSEVLELVEQADHFASYAGRVIDPLSTH